MAECGAGLSAEQAFAGGEGVWGWQGRSVWGAHWGADLGVVWAGGRGGWEEGRGGFRRWVGLGVRHFQPAQYALPASSVAAAPLTR